MDMTLSKRGDYVVRSAISLARAFEEGVPRKIREVVSEMEVPVAIVAAPVTETMIGFIP